MHGKLYALIFKPDNDCSRLDEKTRFKMDKDYWRSKFKVLPCIMRQTINHIPMNDRQEI